jgi:uncharacterized membrane protein
MRKRDTRKLLATAIGIGAVAGLRSMTAPAVVIWATEQNWIQVPSRRLKFLKSKRTAAIVSALAVGELVMDKLPSTPNRTKPLGLAARAVSGGLSAAVVCASSRKLVVPGAALGALAAIGGAFAGYTIRKQLDEKLALSDKVVAVAEDALASASGVLLLRAA